MLTLKKEMKETVKQMNCYKLLADKFNEKQEAWKSEVGKMIIPAFVNLVQLISLKYIININF